MPSKTFLRIQTFVSLHHIVYSFLRDELEVTDEMGDDIDLADLVPKIYEPIALWETLQTKLVNSMNKMNAEIRGSNMDLVFFKDAMIHLLRVRIYTCER